MQKYAKISKDKIQIFDYNPSIRPFCEELVKIETIEHFKDNCRIVGEELEFRLQRDTIYFSNKKDIKLFLKKYKHKIIRKKFLFWKFFCCDSGWIELRKTKYYKRAFRGFLIEEFF